MQEGENSNTWVKSGPFICSERQAALLLAVVRHRNVQQVAVVRHRSVQQVACEQWRERMSAEERQADNSEALLYPQVLTKQGNLARDTLTLAEQQLCFI